MHLKRILVTSVTAGILFPAFVSAATIAEIQAQIQALMAQIATLQAQGVQGGVVAPQSGPAVSSICLNLARNLSRSSRGSDVAQLQQFLISQNLLSADSATGFFGALTENAVKQWQSKNGIVVAGTPATTGYGAVGPKTRAALANCAPQSGPSTGSPSWIAPPGTSGGNTSTNAPPTIYSWQTGGWTTCANSTQSRTVSCVSSNNTTASDAYCTSAKPTASQLCSVTTTPSNQSCTFNNQTIAHGASVAAYQAQSVAYGQTCAQQTRTCTNGTLSGSYAYTSCALTSPTCTPLASQTQTLTCPTGQTGSITQTRTSSCATGATTPTWSAWTTTANTCATTTTNTITCGTDVVNNPSVDAASSLQACIAQAANTIELVPGRYYIASTLDIGNRSNVIIQTKGVSAGSACLQAGAAACAIITASPQNAGPVLFKSTGASNLTLRYIALDGNNAFRRATLGNPNWIGGSAYNAKINACTDCHFYGFASVRAPQGTGLEFEGDRAIFDNSLFRDNGWGQLMYPAGSAWADGLTIWSSDDIVIRNSEFSNNSDINLILGDAPRAVIENNTFKNTYNFAFASFMLDNYNGAQPGRFDGAMIRNNSIDCGRAMCGIGINIGGRLWYPAPLITGGTITDNTIVGAKQGILINGVSGTTVKNNQVTVAGSYAKDSCSTNALGITSGESAAVIGNNVAASANQLIGCGPGHLPLALLQQSGTDSQIMKLYRDILGRDSDITGGNAFSYALQTSMTLSEVRSEIAHSPEAKSKVNTLYQEILKRAGDTAGIDNWLSVLAVGQLTIDQIRISFLTSAEGQSHAYDQ